MFATQVVISDEEIEHDILQSYRPLSSPDGVGTWTTLGKYSIAFRRLLGQREVWVETPVHRFSVTANAMKVDKGAKDQSFFYGDLGRLRWWFKGRSSAPRVRFGNATKARLCSPSCFHETVELANKFSPCTVVFSAVLKNIHTYMFELETSPKLCAKMQISPVTEDADTVSNRLR